MHRKHFVSHRAVAHPSRHTVLAISLLMGFLPTAYAETTSVPDTAPMLKEVTVSATRTERRLDNVPNTVTVVTQEDAERKGARNIKEMFSDELGVNVQQGPNRYTTGQPNNNRAGDTSINIRGLEGNQVLMMIDGIRVPNSFSFGPFLSAGRADYFDIMGFKKAEILRGPASTQYGSDGLSGAVLLETLDPQDLLKAGQSFGGFVKSGYNSVDQSWANALGLAGQNQDWQALLQVSYSDGHEVSNMGGNTAQNITRTAPNPTDTGTSNVLAKLRRRLDNDSRLGLTVESYRRRIQTEVYSARDLAPYRPGQNTLDMQADDHIDRDRVSLRYQYDNASHSWWQKADTQLYWQRAKVVQTTLQSTAALPPIPPFVPATQAQLRTRDNAYISDTFGISHLMQSALPGPVKQQLSYGFDWSQSRVKGPTNGSNTPEPPTYNTPSKAFPDTTYIQAGVFIQDEIEAGKFSIIPGLRFDQYRLSPSSSGYTGTGSIVSLSGHALTPRLGVVWRLAPAFAPYAQWARGFRAPTPDQVNNGYEGYNTRDQKYYRTDGNPNLKAERANSIELGLRGTIDQVRYSFAYYDNRYDDFIDQQISGGGGATKLDPIIYQYVNLKDARIYGMEARADWQIDDQWNIKGGIATARGHSMVNGTSTPLNSIDPLKVVLTVAYDTERWGGNATVQYAGAKKVSDIAPPTKDDPYPQFPTSSWTTLDLGVYWKPMKALTLNAGINNVFNRKYWRWSDVRGMKTTDPAIDGWTAPGRNAYLSARYDF